MKNVLKLVSILCIQMMLMPLCAQEMANIIRPVSAFKSIDLSTGINAEYYESDECKVVIVVPEASIANEFDVKVFNDVLKIRRNSKKIKKSYLVQIYGPSVNAIDVSMGSAMNLPEKISTTNMELTVEHGSSFKGALKLTGEANIEAELGSAIDLDVEAPSVIVNSKHGSSVKLMGDADSANIRAELGSSVNAKKLSVKSARVKAFDGSSVNMAQGGEIDASSDRSSSIN